MNIPLGPAALVIDRAATMTLGYTLACTDLMHTAAGTLTIELPSAPIPPAMSRQPPCSSSGGAPCASFRTPRT